MDDRYSLPCAVKTTLAILFLAAASVGPLPATSYKLVSDSHLSEQADLIARVEIVSARNHHRKGLWTRYEARLLEVLKGDGRPSRVEFWVIGGTTRGGTKTLAVFGAPEFSIGERALLFLARGRDGRFRVLHLLQGVFRPVRVDQQDLLARDGGEPLESGQLAAGATRGDLLRHEGRFVAWLRDWARGEHRPADYLVEARRGARVRPKFQLLSDGADYRWFDFDGGGAVPWFRHEDGQPGLNKGGVNAFNRAVKAWNEGRSGAPVRFESAGSTGSKASFSRPDGRNTITFRDHNNILGGRFNCDTGGVLTLGGVVASGSARPWKGRQFRQILEAEVLINSGAQCLFEVYPSVATQLYVHGLGHALGLGHSCSFSQPECDGTLGDATMSSFLHVPGRADRLGTDDLMGVRYLYHPDATAVPCHLRPGKRAFCGRCGPCGEGQGNCRSDRECSGALECKRGVGSAFGFKPQTNVCVAPD